MLPEAFEGPRSNARVPSLTVAPGIAQCNALTASAVIAANGEEHAGRSAAPGKGCCKFCTVDNDEARSTTGLHAAFIDG